MRRCVEQLYLCVISNPLQFREHTRVIRSSFRFLQGQENYYKIHILNNPPFSLISLTVLEVDNM